MICMIGKNLRRRAFAAVIALTAGLIALVFAVGAVISGALLIRSGRNAEQFDDEGAVVLKNADVSLYDPARDGEVIRLHIIANSDSEEDQRIKLLVRDKVLSMAHLSDDIMHPHSADSAERLLKSEGSRLLNEIRETLRGTGANYDAQLIIGDFEFPDREYGGKLYPSGEYRALRILLGDAKGKNWWCILFPPLCIIRTEDQIQASLKEQGAGADPDTAHYENTALPGETIKFESLLVRLFNKLFHEEKDQ